MHRALALLATVALFACDNSGSGTQVGDVCPTPGYLCATPSCFQFPETPGCTFVPPSNAYCPLDHAHCFDPKTISAYCDPALGLCAKDKNPLPMQCPPMACTQEEIAVCHDIAAGVVCTSGYSCVMFDCPDGGAGGDAAMMVDAGAGDAAVGD